jgi:hypothetical protein
MTIMGMVKNARHDARAQEEIKTTACLVAAWIVGSVIGIVGGIWLFA